MIVRSVAPRGVHIPYSPRIHQRLVHDSPARYITLVAHRRFGKSVFALNHIVRAAIRKRGRYAIVCPMFDQSRSIYFTSGLVEKYVPKEAVRRIDANAMIIYFKNGSTLEFAGADNPRKYNKYRGAQFDGLIMDEFSDHDYNGWKTVFRYTIAAQADGSFAGGWVIFTGTLKGENHLWNEFQRKGTNRASFLFRASETKILTEEDIQDIREECDGDESIMKQELECIPMHYSGLIYKEWGDHNIIPAFDMPVEWAWGYGMDHGGNNATAFGVYRIDFEGNIYRVGEYYKSKTTIYDHAPVIKTMRTTHDKIIADPSMFYKSMQGKKVSMGQVVHKRFSVVDEYEEEGIHGWQEANNDVMAGITRMKKYLRFDPERIHPITGEKGSPKFFVIEGSSPYFEQEIRSYKWKQKKENLNDPDEPVKHNDHAMDESRYFVMSRPEAVDHSPTPNPSIADKIKQLRRGERPGRTKDNMEAWDNW